MLNTQKPGQRSNRNGPIEADGSYGATLPIKDRESAEVNYTHKGDS